MVSPRPTRFWLLGGAIAAAAVAVALVAVLASRHETAAPTPALTATTSTPGAAIEGVPQHGLTLGKAAAPATLYVFEDPQCPYCQLWSLQTMPETVRQLVRTGAVKLVLQPVEILGEQSVPGVRALYAAAAHDRAWNMLEALYERQGREQSGWITEAVIGAAAEEAGLTASQILGELGTASVTSAWQEVEARRNGWGIQGTPTFVVQKTLGRPQLLSGYTLEPDNFAAAVAAAVR